MTEPQIILTPAGEELVVLPRAEYDILLARAAISDEDEDDVAIYDLRKAEACALPREVSAGMLRGDTLLRAIRRWRGVSQIEVARRSGLGQGYLSDLEKKRRTGTEATMERLAAALDVPADWLK